MAPPSAPHPVALPDHARILVIRTGDLGDALLAAPMLRALRNRYPAAQLDLLASAPACALLGDCPHVDTRYILPPVNARGIARLAWLATRLRAARYDTLVFANHLTLPSGRRWRRWLATAIGARLTVGLDNGYGNFLRLRVPDAGFGAAHEVEYALALAASLDARLQTEERAPMLADLGWPDLHPSPPRDAAGPRIVMHPSSGAYSVARRWPVARYIEVARTLRQEFQATLTLVGGPEERDLAAGAIEALDAPDWVVDYTGKTSPRQLAELLVGARLFIGNDSFPMHLATAAGVPVIAIFGPTNVRAWGPYAPGEDERVAAVHRRDLPCSPCVYRGHDLGTPQGCPKRPCLVGLETGAVLSAARRLLRRSWKPQHA